MEIAERREKREKGKTEEGGGPFIGRPCRVTLYDVLFVCLCRILFMGTHCPVRSCV